jgi:TRAP-type transport system periplasmic protein
MSNVRRRQVRRRKYFLGAVGALSVPFGAPAIYSARAAETYTLRLNVTTAAASPFGLAALQFARSVERRSNGQIKIEVYPNGQLLNERESIDGLTTGVLDLAIQATGFLVPLFPRYQVFDLPFFFKDLAAGFRVLDGRIGDEFFADLESKGIIGLTWGTGGFKELETTSRPVIEPSDMKGLRIRVLNSPVYISTYQALGAIPIPLDVNETFVALKQGVVDGLDINLPSFKAFLLYSVVKQVALANHFFSINLLLGSKRKIEALPAALQRLIKAEGKALLPYWRSINERETAESIRFLKDNGVRFTQIQYPAFRKAMEPVYATFQAKLGGDLIDRISRAANG